MTQSNIASIRKNYKQRAVIARRYRNFMFFFLFYAGLSIAAVVAGYIADLPWLTYVWSTMTVFLLVCSAHACLRYRKSVKMLKDYKRLLDEAVLAEE